MKRTGISGTWGEKTLWARVGGTLGHYPAAWSSSLQGNQVGEGAWSSRLLPLLGDRGSGMRRGTSCHAPVAGQSPRRAPTHPVEVEGTCTTSSTRAFPPLPKGSAAPQAPHSDSLVYCQKLLIQRSVVSQEELHLYTMYLMLLMGGGAGSVLCHRHVGPLWPAPLESRHCLPSEKPP